MASKRRTQPAYDPRSVKERIVNTPLGDEMSRSFLAYAYSVIYARALPDARDGLKPVQRRIIYQMGQMNLTPDHPYMKSARVVGEVMGKLHPHGDSAIYEAMVRLAQPFAMRLPLVDGHGNFGSLDDGPAASRYTEARLAPAALGMNADTDEDTVDFSPNYDNSLKEPDVLPSAIPNLLVNGASGIAVGMATNMATHNLGEVVGAAKHLMAHPQADVDELMRFVPGPDLPTGGIIVGLDGIRKAYAHGRGAFVTRARTHVEQVTARRKAIIVTELPFMVGPERVLARIGEGVKSRRLEGIANAVDLTDRHHGTRLMIELKSGFDPGAVLARLFRHTPLEESFTINSVALVAGRPRTMGLKELLQVWIDHRRQVVRRRSVFRRRRAQERLHLVAGLLLALVDIDQVIRVIRGSDDADAAQRQLMATFDLDEVQARYILDLRLRRLTRMSRIELESERDELSKRIAELEGILASPAELDRVVVHEMDAAAARWGTPRRTALLDAEASGELAAEPAGQAAGANAGGGTGVAATHPTPAAGDGTLRVADTPCVVMLSASGLIARAPENVWPLRTARPPKDRRAPDDQIRSMFRTSVRADYALITSAGRLVTAHVTDLPALPASQTLSVSGGVHADELLAMTTSTRAIPGERTVAAVALRDARPLALGTRHGIVKRWNRDTPRTMDSWSVVALKDGDAVLDATPAADGDRLVFVTSDAQLLTFGADQVRPQGRGSTGMLGIRLHGGAKVIAFGVVPAESTTWRGASDDRGRSAVILTVAGDSSALPGTETGSAKVTPLAAYPVKRRGTGGVRTQRFLKGQNTLLTAAVGLWPLHASSASGAPVSLPAVDPRRDGPGRELPAAIAYVG